jgi:membrane fusion protein (multidrug efflux system)
MKSPLSRILIVLIVVVALIAGAVYIFIHRNEETTDDAAIAGNTMTISPQIAGTVLARHIDDNQQVKTGDVLLEIDPATYLARRDKARAALDAALAAAEGAKNSAESTDVSAPSNLAAAQAQVDAAQANWTKAQNDLQRLQKISAEARSQQELDAAIASEKSAHSNFDDATAKLHSAQTAPKTIAEAVANTEQLIAQAAAAQADLAQAEIDLADTKIVAPVDGHITKRSFEVGDYVQPGQLLGSIVSNDLWVVANFKETQLRYMRIGQPVTIQIDAYPGQKLKGKVDSIQSGTGAFFSAFPPENATGNFVKIVQRVPVKITFEEAPDAALALGPGMSVDPIVDVGSGKSDDTKSDTADNGKD